MEAGTDFVMAHFMKLLIKFFIINFYLLNT